jgi:hypothetical protein
MILFNKLTLALQLLYRQTTELPEKARRTIISESLLLALINSGILSILPQKIILKKTDRENF